MSQEEAVQEMKDRPVVSIETAGAALGVRSSRAYQLADLGTIPTIQLSPGRRVVPSAKLLELLGIGQVSA